MTREGPRGEEGTSDVRHMGTRMHEGACVVVMVVVAVVGKGQREEERRREILETDGSTAVTRTAIPRARVRPTIYAALLFAYRLARNQCVCRGGGGRAGEA